MGTKQLKLKSMHPKWPRSSYEINIGTKKRILKKPPGLQIRLEVRNFLHAVCIELSFYGKNQKTVHPIGSSYSLYLVTWTRLKSWDAY